MGYISMSGHTGYMVFELFWPEKGIILTLLVYNMVYFSLCLGTQDILFIRNKMVVNSG